MFKKIGLIITAATLIFMAAVFVFAKDIQVRVSEQDAQRAIDRFTASNPSERLGFYVTPQDISIDFRDDGKAYVKGHMALDGHGYSGEFQGTFSTGIHYNRPRLYLEDLSLVQGGFKADEATVSELNVLKEATINLVERKRKSDEAPDLMNKPGQTSENFVDEMTVAATKSVIQSIPIYDLKQAEKIGFAASLALKNVTFEKDVAILTFSPKTALLRILATLGLFFLTLAWFIFTLNLMAARE